MKKSHITDDGRTPSVFMSMRGPQEHGSRRNHRIYNPNNTPVLYAAAGREVFAGQRMSVMGRQSSLYEWLPIGKLLQPGTTWASTAPSITTNVSKYIEEAQKAALKLCQAIPLVVFHPDALAF